ACEHRRETFEQASVVVDPLQRGVRKDEVERRSWPIVFDAGGVERESGQRMLFALLQHGDRRIDAERFARSERLVKHSSELARTAAKIDHTCVFDLSYERQEVVKRRRPFRSKALVLCGVPALSHADVVCAPEPSVVSLKLLSERVAVVSGASSGIGEATALALASHGAKVVLGARREDRLEGVAERIKAEGGQAETLPLDVADAESCRQFFGAVEGRHPAVDILINNAGLARGLGPVAAGDERDWREMVEANLMGLMRMTRLFLPGMVAKKRGDIVHVGSIAGVQPYANGAAYCASKGAVEAFV